MKRGKTNTKRKPLAVAVEPVVRCKDCIYFVRGRWKNMLTGEDEGPQCGGKCDMLQKALGIDNSSLWMLPALYVQDTFGCVLGRTSNPVVRVATESRTSPPRCSHLNQEPT